MELTEERIRIIVNEEITKRIPEITIKAEKELIDRIRVASSPKLSPQKPPTGPESLIEKGFG